MKININHAAERGFADHGWLKVWHTFNFSDYFNPLREKFGVIRVLNDEIIMPGESYEMHHYKNLEIIVIPISGSIIFLDNSGNESILDPNDVLLISAGKGISYLLKNKSNTEPASLIQIWIFPKTKNEEPSVNIHKCKADDDYTKQKLIASSHFEDNVLQINQDAFLSRLNLISGQDLDYNPYNTKNVVLIFVIRGSIIIKDDLEVFEKDSIEIKEIELPIKLRALSAAQLLIIETIDDTNKT